MIRGGGLTGTGFTARLSPLDLKISEQVRLKRLAPKAVYKEPDRQLVVPLPSKAHPALALVDLLRGLVPVESRSSEPVPAS